MRKRKTDTYAEKKTLRVKCQIKSQDKYSGKLEKDIFCKLEDWEKVSWEIDFQLSLQEKWVSAKCSREKEASMAKVKWKCYKETSWEKLGDEVNLDIGQI